MKRIKESKKKLIKEENREGKIRVYGNERWVENKM